MRFIDVYLCLTIPNNIRYGFAVSVVEKWRTYPWARIHILHPIDRVWIMEHPDWIQIPFHGVGLLSNFQREARIFADRQARTDPYIIADDDCLPIDDPMGIVEVLLGASSFSVLASTPINAGVDPWKPEGYKGYSPIYDELIMEHASVGGIKVCRKHLLNLWPPLITETYDLEQCMALRDENKRVGFSRNHFFNHLGEGI